MQGPLLVIDDDVDIFETIEAAERNIEPADVRQGRLVIYDKEGRIVRPLIVKRLLAEVVEFDRTASTESNVDAVRSGLVRFLRTRESAGEPDYEGLPLDALFARALKYKST